MLKLLPAYQGTSGLVFFEVTKAFERSITIKRHSQCYKIYFGIYRDVHFLESIARGDMDITGKKKMHMKGTD